jgi:L-rhamnose isomerase
MKKESLSRAHELAVERYAEAGVDAAKAVARLKKVSLSLHCWQGDDVGGFERPDAALSGGGIQVTGNYPGKARSIAELRSDLEKVYSLLPGKHRLALHAIYGEFEGRKVDRDQVEPRHFDGWMAWAKTQGLGLDFNATVFSHPRADSGYTLSDRDPAVRDFWIEHVSRCREISAHLGKGIGSPAVHNLWVPDGSKDATPDRLGYRERLKASLDKIFAKDYPEAQLKDAVESKLFGLGSESFVVGSHEFYLAYALKAGKMVCLDLGHFHPTESIADKVSALLLFFDELLFHVSRGVRWDSDHVVVLDDIVRALMEELVRARALDRVCIGLDFFDGTLNRIGAWTLGARAVLKAALLALLEPTERLLAYDREGNNFARLALFEEARALPFGVIWDHYCAEEGVPTDGEIIQNVLGYERAVTSKRR